jgi:phage baseplate assembly protein V
MKLRAAILSMFRRAVLVGSTEVATGLQRLRATAGDDLEDDLEHAEPYGLAAAPPVGAHVFLAQLGGDGASTVALVASDGTFRPVGLTPGDVALYDATGKRVTLSVAGILLGTGATKGVARAGDSVSVTIPIGAIVPAGPGGPIPAAPLVVTGTITGPCSTTVKAVD